MKLLTIEWIEKAEGDWIVAQQCYRARKFPNYDAACFHSQQCAEKLLKARLVEAGINFPRTHDLVTLLQLVLPIEPNWASLQIGLIGLNGYSVAFRYPGSSATKPSAKAAIKECKEIRRVIRLSFGLPL
ncbi:MAG: HEPN domain-containing protein [Acidobacteria bacterium]|nr:HEPN domain-containing protein [Acidobacteriota bacterium]